MKCTVCNIRPANHSILLPGNERHLCCECYVSEGNLPADWHPDCIATVNRRIIQITMPPILRGAETTAPFYVEDEIFVAATGSSPLQNDRS